MKERIDIRKAGGVILKNRRFLVTRAKGKDVFVAPGGKLEEGETHKQALKRELREEIQIEVNEENLEELGAFYAPAAGNESKMLEMVVFIVNEAAENPKPSNEIEETAWVNTQTTGIKLGSIFEHEVMPKLKEQDLID